MNRLASRCTIGGLLTLLAACHPDWIDDPSGPLRRLSVSPTGLRCAEGERQRIRIDVELTPGTAPELVTVRITPDNENVAVLPDTWQGAVSTDSTAILCQVVGSTTLSVSATTGTRRLTAKVPVTITAR